MHFTINEKVEEILFRKSSISEIVLKNVSIKHAFEGCPKDVNIITLKNER